MSVVDKLCQIGDIITDIEKEDPGMAAILQEGFGLSLRIIKEVSERGQRDTIDVSEHIEIMSKILGVSLNDLVMSILNNQGQESNKEPDQATLDFITSDMDDYEKFLAQNKAKTDLDFLSKNI